jgi:hypothetical protein
MHVGAGESKLDHQRELVVQLAAGMCVCPCLSTFQRRDHGLLDWTSLPTTTTMAERTNPNMLFANFNQDYSYVLKITHPFFLLICRRRCISVGTRKGYSITNCDPFGRVYTMSASAVLCLVTDIQR